jgi:lipid-binding SYLF domain-containing protein
MRDRVLPQRRRTHGPRPGGSQRWAVSIAAVSYGLQAGAQSFSHVIFFMTDAAFQYAKESDGWEFGVGPSVVVLDEEGTEG